MWIASKLGFYSIVRKEGGIHIRARVKRDLENLVAAAKLQRVEILEWKHADYRWRIRVNAAQLTDVYLALMESVDYPNFKSEIAATPDQRAKLGAYHTFWGEMMRVQMGDEVASGRF